MHLRRQKEEAEKWKNVPEWKRKILMEKAAMKSDTDEQFAIDEVSSCTSTHRGKCLKSTWSKYTHINTQRTMS